MGISWNGRIIHFKDIPMTNYDNLNNQINNNDMLLPEM